MRYDIAIIGTGPAGLSASIEAKIRNKNVIIFGSNELSKKVAIAPSIENYLGIPNTTGKDILENFSKHIQEMGIEITEERVNAVYSMGDYFSLMAGEKIYESTTVILATGVEFSRPVDGEVEFLGRGVGYCASCDAPLYRGKTVAVLGYNEEAEEDANFLSEIAEKVYYIPMKKTEMHLNENVEIIKDRAIKITGDTLARKVILKNQEIDVDGVFVIKDSISPAHLVPSLAVDGIHIKNNKNLETNIKGLFVAGDCAGKPYKYVKSAGEGQIASFSAISYLDSLKK